MSRRNLTILNTAKNILLSNIPKSTTIRCNNKLNIKLIRNNKRVFLSPKHIDYSNYVHKRNYSPCKKNDYNRHKYDVKIESLINEQINVEFGAGYAYLNMAVYFGQSNIALPGLYGFFMKMYYEEQQHGLDFVNYQILRGGKVCLKPIPCIEERVFDDIPDVLTRALVMEKDVKEKLQRIYRVANDNNDTNVMDMLDSFIAQQEKSICEISRLFTRASELTCTEVGKYLFDRELHETHVKGEPGKCVAEIGSKLYT